MAPTRYGPFHKFLHWTIFLMIVGLWCLAHLRGYYPKDDIATRSYIMGLHISCGLLMLFLVIVRVLWRLTHAIPELPAATPTLEAMLAKLTHLVFYALMLVIPLLGIYVVWLYGHGASFFNLVTIPQLVEKNMELHDKLGKIHEWLANIVLFLLAFHVVAALWHHYVKKDDVLRRMLPW